jgi:hypothetical protein
VGGSREQRARCDPALFAIGPALGDHRARHSHTARPKTSALIHW